MRLRRTTRIESPIAMAVVGVGFIAAMMAAFMLQPTLGLPIALVLVVAALFVRRALARSTITIDDAQIVERSFGRTRSVRFADLERYRFNAYDPNAQMLGGTRGGLAGSVVRAAAALESGDPQHRKFLAGALTVYGRDGSVVELAATYAHAAEALDHLFPILHAKLADSVPRMDIDHIEVTRDGMVTIDGNSSIRLAAVDNSMLLLEQLAEAGASINVAAQVYLSKRLRERGDSTLRAAS